MTSKKVGSSNKRASKVATDGFNVDVLTDKLAKLQALVPEAFVEGKLDPTLFGKIFKKDSVAMGKEALAGTTESEQYGLSWAGKRLVYDEIAKQSVCTLTLDQKRSLPRGTLGQENVESGNVFIEGENLEVLRTLQKAYYNKIKMIYIDPPYNTGKDFVYHDNFRQTEDEYFCDECNITAAGHLTKAFKLNSRDGGRFHSNWLNMIYPRLFLARNLLRDDGVIFVSIDDNEVHNLRLIMNEIFGEENFVTQLIWEKKYTRSNDAKYFSDNHDHILVFSKNINVVNFNKQPRNEQQLSAYTNPDNHPKGLWKSTPIHAKSGNNTNFKYTFKNGLVWQPPRGTFPRFSEARLKELENNNEIWFGIDGKSNPARKSFLCDVSDGVVPITIWKYDEVGHNHESNQELKSLDLNGFFDNPKPTRLVQRILQLSTNKDDNDIILDFFAGSGTTAHAVMAQNIADGGNRSYVCVQMPEETPVGSEARKAGYERISEIAIERIKRASAKLKV
ncbi:MAG: hypothetical protein RLZZ230_612 [Candidatus Parcubacteria bacterium]|jgi:adenine-specific DNA-methyltransferase